MTGGVQIDEGVGIRGTRSNALPLPRGEGRVRGQLPFPDRALAPFPGLKCQQGCGQTNEQPFRASLK